MKKILIGLVSVISLSLLLTGCGNKKKPIDKINEKEQAVIIEDQQVGDFNFNNFNVVKDEENNTSHIYFEVVNNTDTLKQVNMVTFTLFSDGAEVVTLPHKLNSSIEAGDMKIVQMSVDVDLTGVDKVEYKID